MSYESIKYPYMQK